jgi:small subunit ribosomal protein S18
MPRINNPKPPKRAPKIDNRRTKKKPCSFCQHGVVSVDYKDLAQLRKYISDRGKIRGRKVSGNCQQHQRDVTDAIKTARELALLPYTQRTVTERRGGRGERGERSDRGGWGGWGAPPPRQDREAEATLEGVVVEPSASEGFDASASENTSPDVALAEQVSE